MKTKCLQIRGISSNRKCNELFEGVKEGNPGKR